MSLIKRFETRQSVEFYAGAPLRGSTKENEDVLKLFGMLHLPEQEPPFPAVLMIHGLAGTKAGRHRLYVRLAEKLSQMGIATLRIDMRGCGDSEGDFRDITMEAQIRDAVMSLEFLAKHPLICKGRIGILGRSMGGAVAVLVAEQARKMHALTLCSMALWCPLFTAKPWLKEWQKRQQALETNTPNTPNTPPTNLQSKQEQELDMAQKGVLFHGEYISLALLQELFSLNLLPALESLRDIPFFFAHSIHDPVVAIEQTHQYLEQRSSGQEGGVAETRFRPFQGKDHEFSSPDEQVDLLEESAQWFQHSLCGQKKPNCVIQKS